MSSLFDNVIGEYVREALDTVPSNNNKTSVEVLDLIYLLLLLARNIHSTHSSAAPEPAVSSFKLKGNHILQLAKNTTTA